jgi:teichoic acid transport system ATP-binding protein
MTNKQEPVVIVSNVSIDYHVRAQRNDGNALSNFMAQIRGKHDIVHAVKNVSFVIHRGESVGLIGTNGSGKSSLIRCIAGLQTPSNGEVFASSVPEMLSVANIMIGRLSGARNVRIALLAKGYSPAEVRELYPKVVSFSQIRDSINFPVNTYSSGMKARLKFAIATVKAPEILLVDEALSTGDTQFREQSTKRLQEINQAANAIIMVNHNEKTITESCTRVIWMEKGELRMDGKPEDVFPIYKEYVASLKKPKA